MARALALGLEEPALFTDGGSGRASALAAEVGGEAVASNAELGGARTCSCSHTSRRSSRRSRARSARRRSCSRCSAASRSPTLAGRLPRRAGRARDAEHGGRGPPRRDLHLRRRPSPRSRRCCARVGTVVRLAERLMDAATAVSGVAPAYVALIAEAWVDAAVGQGIPAAQAAELVADSLAGSAALLLAHHMDTLGVRRAVTSPGGMTARGLRALEQAGAARAFSDAAAAVVGSGRRSDPRRSSFAQHVADYVVALGRRLHDRDHRLRHRRASRSASACGSPTRAGATPCSTFLRDVTEPYLRIFRRILPSFGGLDLQPDGRDHRAPGRGATARRRDPAVSARAALARAPALVAALVLLVDQVTKALVVELDRARRQPPPAARASRSSTPRTAASRSACSPAARSRVVVVTIVIVGCVLAFFATHRQPAAAVARERA